MSHIKNDLWLENSRELFEDAVTEGNLPLVKDIIADVMDVSPEAARNLNEVVRNLPINTWRIISPLQPHDL